MRSKRLGAGCLAVVALAWIASCGSDDDGSSTASINTVTVGALLSLTGNWYTLGQNSQVALELGVADVNAYLVALGSSLRVALAVRDTKLDPAMALDALKALAGQGVRIVVGPQSSAEVAALKPFADASGVLVVSQGSTAHSLAIAGDNILRLCPDDVQEGAAVTALMFDQGKRIIVPVTRDDPGNQGLQVAAKNTFESLGGTVLPLIVYAPDTQDFSPTVEAVAAAVDAAETQSGAGAVAVYLTAFDEGASIFEIAQPRAALSAVRWYGSDGIASSAALSSDATAAAFAATVGFPCPIFGLDPLTADKWQPLLQRVQAQTGFAPDAFALSTYDAVWIAALAYLQAGSGADVLHLKTAFTQTANSYFGVTGPTQLNAAGDRASGTFDFLAVCAGSGAYSWQNVGTFEPMPGGPGTVTFAGCHE